MKTCPNCIFIITAASNNRSSQKLKLNFTLVFTCARVSFLRIKTREYVKLTIKLKRHRWRRSALLSLNLFHFLLQCCWLWSVNCRLGLLFAVLTLCVCCNLGKVSTYGETRQVNCTSEMYENTWGRVTFIVNLMFRRLDKFDGLIFGRCISLERGSYIRDAN